ncbi:NAD(P)-binding domain-containing protein [Streptomyces nitrosporeus]|uniref:NAD(P)-binding domain-containing protein n=1 Tax=Streptomyces nitrosporeus TaxID=28894 RepID=UPI003327ADA8
MVRDHLIIGAGPVGLQLAAPLERDGRDYAVLDGGGRSWQAERLVMATGVPRLHEPPVPGLGLAERYDTFDPGPASFTKQRVLVVGKGNSAFETADGLMEKAAVIHVAGPRSVEFAWKTHCRGHLRAVNNNFLDTYQLKSQNAVLDGTVESIEKSGGGGFRVMLRYARITEPPRELHYDQGIVRTGFRYATRALHRILGARHLGTPWPARTFTTAPEAIADAVIGRVNRSSGLWQQFGFLGDVVGVDGDRAVYQEEVPLDYVTGGGLGPAPHRFVVDLEYGPEHERADPFDVGVPRVVENDADRAMDSTYLHPVVRHYRDGVPAGTLHLAENLENEWNLPAVHRQPLTAFVKECHD